MYDAGEMVREMYGNSRVSTLNNIIAGEIKKMFSGSQTPEETAAAIQTRWEEQGNS
jgi:hypothetical protein